MILKIDRSIPFDPTSFIGVGWTIWRGPADKNGFEDREDQDDHSLALTKVDFSEVIFRICLNGEFSITGEEKLNRLKAGGQIRLDALIGQALIEEPNHQTLECLWPISGITYFDFPGTVIRSPSGRRHIFCIWHDRDGWSWFSRCLGDIWDANTPSAVLPQSS